jgi:hypothetical protein
MKRRLAIEKIIGPNHLGSSQQKLSPSGLEDYSKIVVKIRDFRTADKCTNEA